MDSFIAPARALKRIADSETRRTAKLQRVEDGDIDTLDTSKQPGVTGLGWSNCYVDGEPETPTH